MTKVNIDANLRNADWTKKSWNLPTTEDEFRIWLLRSGMSFAKFKTLPVYQMNKDRYSWLANLEFAPISDFSPGLLSGLLDDQPMRRPK